MWNFPAKIITTNGCTVRHQRKAGGVFPSDPADAPPAQQQAAAGGRGAAPTVRRRSSPNLSGSRNPFVLISPATWCISPEPVQQNAAHGQEELQQTVFGYMEYRGKPSRPRRLFAGMSITAGETAGGTFNVAPDYYKDVAWDAGDRQKLSGGKGHKSHLLIEKPYAEIVFGQQGT